MKTLFKTILMLLIFGGLSAQNCSKFYPFEEGATTQLTMYDKNGKMEAMVEYTVNSLSSTADAEIANMSHKLIDDKGNLISTSTYEVTCSKGVVSMDFKSLSRPELLEQFGDDVDVTMTGTNIDYPNDLSVGQSLPDAGMFIKINLSGINMNMNTEIKDRKVIGQEKITTPAGTFDCYIITATTEMKMATKMTSHSKQWIAEGVGVVKVEDYNKKGKLQSMGLLTSFSK